MSYEVVVTDEARRHLLEFASWWAEQRSREQAERWLAAFEAAIANLANVADKQPPAYEAVQLGAAIKQLSFGVRNRRTHRAVFRIREGRAEVLAIRHLAQRELDADDLPN